MFCEWFPSYGRRRGRWMLWAILSNTQLGNLTKISIGCDNYMPYNNFDYRVKPGSLTGCDFVCNGNFNESCGAHRLIQVYNRISPSPVFSGTGPCLDQTSLGAGRDAANYHPFGFQPIVEGADVESILFATLLNPNDTTNQQWILGVCFLQIYMANGKH